MHANWEIEMFSIQAIEGQAVAIRIDNLDTDQVMPKQFLRRIDKSGLVDGLFYDLRFDNQGHAKPDFVLNQPQYAKASILLGGSNFGCGSSREHAVWGIAQYGFKAIIAPSFAEIFYSNAMGNQLLLVALPPEQVQALMALSETPDAPTVQIDLEKLEVRCGDLPVMKFEISQRHQEMFLRGVDVVGMSLTHRDEIQAFARAHWAAQPWLQDVAARMKARAS
jgi:3-isopropylmalate/(R)-2-methylmalate dehydratase small subunit